MYAITLFIYHSHCALREMRNSDTESSNALLMKLKK